LNKFIFYFFYISFILVFILVYLQAGIYDLLANSFDI